jgi:citrate lyase subunit beta/citryl-CoA lyase
VVRINASGTPWHADDLLLLAEWTTRGIAGTMVPKAESPGGLRALGVALGPDACLLPLVESLAGFDAVNLIAATPQVARIAFGNLDFQLDVGMRCGLGEGELASVRFALVAASRRAGLPAPIDGVTADTSNVRRLADDVDRARGFGFGGKLCIHPGQVGALNAAFTSSEAEVEWARRVLAGAAANAGAAFRLDSRMVDLPVIRQAERTLQQAAQRPA